MLDEVLIRIRHIRKIHFSFILMSSITAYLTFIGYEKIKGFGDEFVGMRNLLTDISKANKHPNTLHRLFPGWSADIEQSINRSIEAQFSSEFHWSNDLEFPIPLLLIRSGPITPSLSNRLNRTRQFINQASWYVRYPVKIEIEDSSFVAPEKSEIELVSRTIDSSSDSVHHGTISMHIYNMKSYMPRAVQEGILDSYIIDTLKLRVKWIMRENELRFGSDFFEERFPLLLSQWNEILHLTIPILEDQLDPTKGMYKGTPNIQILGFSFSARHIGYIGPILIFGLLLYLLVHLFHLRVMLAHLRVALPNSHAVSLKILAPWIGIMNSVPSTLIMVFTTFIASTVVVFLVLYYITELNLFAVFLSSSLGLVLGTKTILVARDCGEFTIRLDLHKTEK